LTMLFSMTIFKASINAVANAGSHLLWMGQSIWSADPPVQRAVIT
jgi:hypothetical protein